MMSTQDPPSTDAAATKAEAIALAAGLHSVMCEAQEGEIVRIALAALQSTAIGRDYMMANPVRY